MRRTQRRTYQHTHVHKCWDAGSQNKTSDISKHAFSDILGLQLAEQHVGNIRKCTSRSSGTLVRSTKGRTPQTMHFPKLWDSDPQNNTSEISNNALSECLGLQSAEQRVRNLRQMHIRKLWHSDAQTKTPDTSNA